MINLMIIYDVVKIFSVKNYYFSRKLRVGVNWYPGVNWSTTTRYNLATDISLPPSSYFEISINLKACIILEWSIIIRFMISTNFKPCATNFHCINTSYLTDDSCTPAPAGPAKRQKKDVVRFTSGRTSTLQSTRQVA